MTSADSNLLQEILEEIEVPVRLRKTLELLKKEYAMCVLQQKIGKEVRIARVACGTFDIKTYYAQRKKNGSNLGKVRFLS